MSEFAPACPKCGQHAAVRELKELVTAQMERRKELMQQPLPPQAPEPSVTASGSGTNASGEQLLVGLVTELLIRAGGEVIRAAVLKPAANWWQTKGEAAMRERRETMTRALSEGVGRHPELYLCANDNLVFVAGGTRTLSARKAFELLFAGDDIGLMSRLNP